MAAERSSASRKFPQSYHLAWLSVHPDRTKDWLKDRLRDGFDVHHVDGDHSNDAPSNLVLIEAVDHLRLHGLRLVNGIANWRRLMAKRAIARKQPVFELTSEPATYDEASVSAYRSRAGRC